ncbi:hypothetical protein [Carboxylicivirga sp. RSCT41]|uniref:hypothetical protein n=1 Tax=Carboxylicivirga agarovorans TaxID=3417570 RepID=UPI003D343F58
MNKLEFYKSIYERENLRRDVLNNSVSIPVGILSGLTASIVYLCTSFDYSNGLYLKIFFLSFVTISAIILFISIIYLIKSFNNFHKGYDYREIALLKDIDKYYVELKEQYKKKPPKAERKFIKYMESEYITYADNNTQINDARSYDLYKSKQFLFYTLITIGLTSIPFGISSYDSSLFKEQRTNTTIEIEQNKTKSDSINLKSINYERKKI